MKIKKSLADLSAEFTRSGCYRLPRDTALNDFGAKKKMADFRNFMRIKVNHGDADYGSMHPEKRHENCAPNATEFDEATGGRTIEKAPWEAPPSEDERESGSEQFDEDGDAAILLTDQSIQTDDSVKARDLARGGCDFASRNTSRSIEHNLSSSNDPRKASLREWIVGLIEGVAMATYSARGASILVDPDLLLGVELQVFRVHEHLHVDFKVKCVDSFEILKGASEYISLELEKRLHTKTIVRVASECGIFEARSD